MSRQRRTPHTLPASNLNISLWVWNASWPTSLMGWFAINRPTAAPQKVWNSDNRIWCWQKRLFSCRISGVVFSGMLHVFISVDSAWTDLQLCFCVGGHQVKCWICFGFLKVQLVVWDLISVQLSTQLSSLNFNVI